MAEFALLALPATPIWQLPLLQPGRTCPPSFLLVAVPARLKATCLGRFNRQWGRPCLSPLCRRRHGGGTLPQRSHLKRTSTDARHMAFVVEPASHSRHMAKSTVTNSKQKFQLPHGKHARQHSDNSRGDRDEPNLNLNAGLMSEPKQDSFCVLSVNTGHSALGRML